MLGIGPLMPSIESNIEQREEDLSSPTADGACPRNFLVHDLKCHTIFAVPVKPASIDSIAHKLGH